MLLQFKLSVYVFSLTEMSFPLYLGKLFYQVLIQISPSLESPPALLTPLTVSFNSLAVCFPATLTKNGFSRKAKSFSCFYNFNKSNKDKNNKTHLVMSLLSLKSYSLRIKSTALISCQSAHALLSSPAELRSLSAGPC